MPEETVSWRCSGTPEKVITFLGEWWGGWRMGGNGEGGWSEARGVRDEGETI